MLLADEPGFGLGKALPPSRPLPLPLRPWPVKPPAGIFLDGLLLPALALLAAVTTVDDRFLVSCSRSAPAAPSGCPCFDGMSEMVSMAHRGLPILYTTLCFKLHVTSTLLHSLRTGIFIISPHLPAWLFAASLPPSFTNNFPKSLFTIYLFYKAAFALSLVSTEFTNPQSD